MDPANGFTAIDTKILSKIDLDNLEKRFFFESDMLMHLNLQKAVVVDVPVEAVYGEEESHLKPYKAFFEFFYKNIRNCFRRIKCKYLSQKTQSTIAWK